MGYRSEVVLAIYGDDLSPEVEDTCDTLFEDVYFTPQGSLFHSTLFKWDDCFPDVAKIMAWLQEHPNDYTLLRIGEEFGDVDQQGNWDNNPFGIGYSAQAEYSVPEDSFADYQPNAELLKKLDTLVAQWATVDHNNNLALRVAARELHEIIGYFLR